MDREHARRRYASLVYGVPMAMKNIGAAMIAIVPLIAVGGAAYYMMSPPEPQQVRAELDVFHTDLETFFEDQIGLPMEVTQRAPTQGRDGADVIVVRYGIDFDENGYITQQERLTGRHTISGSRLSPVVESVVDFDGYGELFRSRFAGGEFIADMNAHDLKQPHMQLLLKPARLTVSGKSSDALDITLQHDGIHLRSMMEAYTANGISITMQTRASGHPDYPSGSVSWEIAEVGIAHPVYGEREIHKLRGQSTQDVGQTVFGGQTDFSFEIPPAYRDDAIDIESVSASIALDAVPTALLAVIEGAQRSPELSDAMLAQRLDAVFDDWGGPARMTANIALAGKAATTLELDTDVMPPNESMRARIKARDESVWEPFYRDNVQARLTIESPAWLVPTHVLERMIIDDAVTFVDSDSGTAERIQLDARYDDGVVDLNGQSQSLDQLANRYADLLQ